MKSRNQHMRRISNAAALLCFVLAGSSMVDPVSGKNILSGILKNDGNTKADKPATGHPNYDDAATGTVQGNTAAKQQASTCDGQLAVALVQANDLASAAQNELDEELLKHKASLETIVGLQQDLRETSIKLGETQDALNKLKDTMTESLEIEKSRSREERKALDDRAEKNLAELRVEKDSIISSLKEESANLLQSAREAASKEFQELKTEKDEMISSLEAQLKMSADELEATMMSELEKARRDKETKVAEIKADREATVAKLTQSMEEAAKNAADVLRANRQEAKATLAAVEADRDAQLATLNQNMEDAARNAAELLQRTKHEADAMLKQQLETAKEAATEAAAGYERKLSENTENMKAIQENAATTMVKLEAIERVLEEANAELFRWRELHSQRTYCNMTHIATDIYDVSAVAYKHAANAVADVYGESVRIASAHIANGVEYSSQLVNDQIEEHWPSIQPYYEEHISNNYQTLVQPHLQKHVFPKLQQASTWSAEVAKPTVLRAIDDGKKSYDAQVAPVLERQSQTLIQIYGRYCRHSLQEFLNASQELQILRDNPPPAFLLNSWETSCENPRDSLTALMESTGVLLLLIFHRRLFNLVWSIVSFSLSLVVRFTPLRFVVPRRSTTKSIASPPSSPMPGVKEASSDSLSLTKAVERGRSNGVGAAGEAKIV